MAHKKSVEQLWEFYLITPEGYEYITDRQKCKRPAQTKLAKNLKDMFNQFGKVDTIGWRVIDPLTKQATV